MESIISLVTNKLVTTILLLALALLAKKYRLLLREVLRERFLRETKKGLLLRSSLRSNVLRSRFAVTYLVTCLAVALLWSKIDSLHSTRVRAYLSTFEQYHAFYTSESLIVLSLNIKHRCSNMTKVLVLLIYCVASCSSSKRRQVCPQSPLLLKSFGDCGRII